MKFKVLASQRNARVGEIETDHGTISTPAFVPVGTQATVKSLVSEDLDDLGASCVLANTYHLYLRPGHEVIESLGGLHKFMSYDKPIFTDSGGFQVFSLGIAMEQGIGKVIDLFADDSREEMSLNKKIENIKEQTAILDRRSFCKIDDEGATFMSHLDGTLHRWTAEKSMEIQSALGADLIFAMDECTSPTHDYEYTKKSMYRSHDWEKRSLDKFAILQSLRKSKGLYGQGLYGIIQGGQYQDLREESTRFVVENNFDGIGIGGALVSKRIMGDVLGYIKPYLDDNRPRHLLGIGGVDDILVGVSQGVDTFDCAHPTRIARRGHLLIRPESGGNIKNKWRVAVASSDWVGDSGPIDRACDCFACRNYSRSYIKHLYWAAELSYHRLATIHNLRFMIKLMEDIRESIFENKFDQFKSRWMVE